MVLTDIDILVVDDEPAVGSVLKDFLSGRGLHVSNAANGQEALGLLEKKEYNLILLDMLMPGLTGAEVAKIIHEKHPFTKIVMITAFPKEKEILTAARCLDGLLIKPFKLQDLYTKLQQVLNTSRNFECVEDPSPGPSVKVLYLKADIIFVGVPADTYAFFEQQLKELTNKGQQYEIRRALTEDDYIVQSSFAEPDIVVVEEAHYRQLDYHTIDRVFLASAKTKEIIPFDTIAAQYNFEKVKELIAILRNCCIRNGLVQIG